MGITSGPDPSLDRHLGAVWLLPDADAQAELQRIGELAREQFECKLFTPHLTIRSGTFSRIPDYDTLQSISDKLGDSLSFDVRGFRGDDAFFKLIHLELAENHRLANLVATVDAGVSFNGIKAPRPVLKFLGGEVDPRLRDSFLESVRPEIGVVRFDKMQFTYLPNSPAGWNDQDAWTPVGPFNLS